MTKHLVESGRQGAVRTDSHAAVENLLDEFIAGRLEPLKVVKVLDTAAPEGYQWSAFKGTSQLSTALRKSLDGQVLGAASFGIAISRFKSTTLTT